MISKIKSSINHWVERVIRPFAHTIHPNTLTFLGLILALIPAILISQGHYVWGAITLGLLLIDVLDGAVARVTQRETQFGGFLDAVIDRVVDGLMIIALVWSGALNPLLGLITMLSFFLVSYTKSKGEAVLALKSIGTNILSIGFAERAERLVVIFIVVLGFSFFREELWGLNMVEGGFLLLIFLSMLTVILRILKVKSSLARS